ncbi:MAG: PspC domain-containing protein [Acidimicrobiia bacterium]|nr:PspC domain-containing protein [Acidimicrobiia bacterium]
MSATHTPPGAPPRRLQRSRRDRVVAGVCGGLGEYFDVDPVIFRIAFVVLAFVGGAGFLLYPAAWLLLPEEGHGRSIGEAWVQRGRRGHWLAIALIAVGALILAGELSHRHGNGIGFAVIAIVIGVVLLRRHPAPPLPPGSGDAPWSTPPPPSAPPPSGPSPAASTPAAPWQAPTAAPLPGPAPDDPGDVAADPDEQPGSVDTAEQPGSVDTGEPTTPPPAATPPPPPHTPPPAPPGGGGGASWGPPAEELEAPRRRSLAAIVVSVLLIGAGTVGLLHAAGVVSVSVPVFLAAALIFTGAAIVFSAWTGGTGGLIGVAVVLTIALAIASVVRAPLSGGIGDRRWVPSSLAEVRSSYEHGGGDVVIDLTHVTFPAEGRLVRVRLGVGHLRVIVPPDTKVAADAHTGAGDIRLFGRHEKGVDVDDSVVSGTGTNGSLTLHLDVGAGQIEVVRGTSVGMPSPPPVPLSPLTPLTPETTSPASATSPAPAVPSSPGPPSAPPAPPEPPTTVASAQ